MINPADYFVPIRYLRVVSSLEEYSESITDVFDKVDSVDNSIEIKRTDKSVPRTKSREIINSSIVAKEEATGDVSRWIDFNKVAPYVKEVHLFYKPEYFQCSIRVMGDMVKTLNENRKVTDAKEMKKEKRGTVS